MKKLRHIMITLCTFGLWATASAQWNNVPIETNGYDQSETAVAYSPLNPNLIMAAWNDFRPVDDPLNTLAKPGFGFSTNNGATWQRGLVPTQQYGYKNGFDPSCAFDRNGYAYYCYIARRNNTTQYLGPVYISRTPNSGANWDHYKVSPDTSYQDKPYMAVDNTGGSRDGRIYVSWTSIGDQSQGVTINLSYSTDHGAIWSTPYILDEALPHADAASIILTPEDTLPPPSQYLPFVHGSVPAVAPNGDLYVAWLYAQSPGLGANAYIRIKKSTDGGVNFQSLPSPSGAISLVWNWPIGSRLRASSMPTLAIDPVSGYIYVAYTVWVGDATGHSDIYCVHSTNNGVSWSPPSIATENTTQSQFFPWLTVSPSGTISLVYYDSYFVDLSLRLKAKVAQSYNKGAYFHTPNFTMTPNGFDPNRGTKFSDYIGITSSSTSDFVAVWTHFIDAPSNQDIYGAIDGTPAQPQNLHFTTNNQVTITWTNNNEPDRQYWEVWRKYYRTRFDQQDWTCVATRTTNSYTDPDFQLNSAGDIYTLYYKIRTKDTQGLYSIFSDVITTNAVHVFWKAGEIASNSAPTEYSISQNYPNPFNPTTTIKYGIPDANNVTLKIFDMLGREVKELVNKEQQPGYYTVTFDAANFPSGVYFCKLQAGYFVNIKKMILQR